MTAPRPAFAAVLTPHRSLTRKGFIAVMALVAGLNLIGGLVFYIAGAWPVAGFMGLDVVLIWWAFKANFAAARRAERVEVTDTEVILSRFAEGRSAQEQRFTRAWLKIELEEDRERELIGGLYLRSHGRRTEIARFLAADEKKSFALALEKALAAPLACSSDAAEIG